MSYSPEPRKTYLTISLIAIFFMCIMASCTTANATQPYNVDVQDYQKTVIKRTPYNVEVCSERKVSGDKTGDALMGAIIGGMLGHQNSTAKDGTELVCRNLTRYKESMETIYSHSTITFNYDGKSYTVRFKK